MTLLTLSLANNTLPLFFSIKVNNGSQCPYLSELIDMLTKAVEARSTPLSYMETLLHVTEAVHISEASDTQAFPFKTPWQLRTQDKLPINKVT